MDEVISLFKFQTTMSTSSQAKALLAQIDPRNTKLGDLRKLAKEIKKDHDLALELWASDRFLARQLAILIMDKKQIDQDFIDRLEQDIAKHTTEEQNQLMDWLLANQLTKDSRTIALLNSWIDSPSWRQRRLFWYFQARLRWTGQQPPENTGELLDALEKKISTENPEVQWAMNFLAGWIGVFDTPHRKRCIALGENTGLFRDEVVAHNCTPNYLPEFIKIEAGKRQLA